MNATMPSQLWSADLGTVCPKPTDWIWPGFIAKSNFTLLTGLWKSGKTTLLSLLLARRHNSAPLLNSPVTSGRTVCVSEESPEIWAERHKALNFGPDLCLFCRPFRGIPSKVEWDAFLASLLVLHNEKPFDLLILDPLAHFLRNENNPRVILSALMPLADFTAKGIGVLATCHPAKGKPILGQAARGSGALPAHADIALELRPPRNRQSRRRHLHGFSRHSSTPTILTITLNGEGTNYEIIDHVKEIFQAKWKHILAVLESAPQKLTAADIRYLWPSEYEKLSISNIRKTLHSAHESGLINCEGTGSHSDPRRYWLTSRVDQWRQAKPLYDFIEEQERACNIPFTSYCEQHRK
jgi:AAA domain